MMARRPFKSLVKAPRRNTYDSVVADLRKKAVRKLPAEELESVRRLKEWRRKQFSCGGWRFPWAPWPWKIDWHKGLIQDCEYKRRIACVIAPSGSKASQIKWGSQDILNRRTRELYAEAATGWLIRAAPELAEALFIAVCTPAGVPVPTRLRKRPSLTRIHRS